MLTRKQHELLTYIDRHLRETGFSPSFEERGFLKRRHHRARALEVTRMPQELLQGRAVTALVGSSPGGTVPPGAAAPASFAPNVIRGDFSSRLPGVRAANEAAAIQLPLYGRIAAGLPIEALRDQGTHVEVPVALLGGGEHYALEVAGDSMVDAGILDGDTVIIRKGEVAENGQIVVALVDDAEVTLKRLRRRANSIALEPANARHEIRIFPADRVKVQGRLIALLRRY